MINWTTLGVLILLTLSACQVQSNLGVGFEINIDGVQTINHSSLGGTTELSVIPVEVVNTGANSINLAFSKHGVVYSDGSSEGIMVGSLFGVFPPNECISLTNKDYVGQFTLFPNAKKKFNLCLNKVDFSRNPTLFISFIKNPELIPQEVNGLPVGYEKRGQEVEFSLPLQ